MNAGLTERHKPEASDNTNPEILSSFADLLTKVGGVSQSPASVFALHQS